MNEHEKIFTLETLIKDLIEFNNKTFFKLYTTTNEKVRERMKKSLSESSFGEGEVLELWEGRH